MAVYQVTVKDKRTEKEFTMEVSSFGMTEEQARAIAESKSTSLGGTHPGLEVIKIEKTAGDYE